MKDRPLFPIYDIMEHWAAFAHSNPYVRPQHHALYFALVQMSKRMGGSTRFNLAYGDGMKASGIGSRNTYNATLKNLEEWGFATYEPGANGLKPPIVAALFCASAEHQLSIYRASTYTSADASAEHILKEVKGLRLEVERQASIILELEEEVSALKVELGGEKSPPPSRTFSPAVRAELMDDGLEVKYSFAESLFETDKWPSVCADIRQLPEYGLVNFEHYRGVIRLADKDLPQKLPNRSWRKKLMNWLQNDLESKTLVKIAVQTPNEVPSNWPAGVPYTAPTSGTIPKFSEFLLPD